MSEDKQHVQVQKLLCTNQPLCGVILLCSALWIPLLFISVRLFVLDNALFIIWWFTDRILICWLRFRLDSIFLLFLSPLAFVLLSTSSLTKQKSLQCTFVIFSSSFLFFPTPVSIPLLFNVYISCGPNQIYPLHYLTAQVRSYSEKERNEGIIFCHLVMEFPGHVHFIFKDCIK